MIALHTLSGIVVIVQHFRSHHPVTTGIGMKADGDPGINDSFKIGSGKSRATYTGIIPFIFDPRALLYTIFQLYLWTYSSISLQQ